ncbi:hypothetical protein [Amycolatopsis vancoresmycina]|uniref:Uncharacterized protein n=1 Tax=Amycolatopsis vancoresmycina DSM 44592 TaxID=1292037 RepID=R1G609_9PSEU|nr:hypothetical protein [Amycolatopsis vancoresmycina]EOD66883.1 hypothetical protein H480_19208 [Amycolatopsis vancoresmycina DSM 44592]
MTPKRRTGTGRAAVDHIAAGLTDALSTLSKVTTAQAAIAEVARGDVAKATALLDRLDDQLLDAIADAAATLQHLAATVHCVCGGRRWVNDENWSPAYPELWRGERSPGDGLVPCGNCNFGGWDVDPVEVQEGKSP